MPLTRTQKILAWSSAGLIATASALGVMFYSPTILGQNHITTAANAKARGHHYRTNYSMSTQPTTDNASGLYHDRNSIYYHANNAYDIYKNDMKLSGLSKDSSTGNSSSDIDKVESDLKTFTRNLDYKPEVLSSNYDNYHETFRKYFNNYINNGHQHKYPTFYDYVMASINSGLGYNPVAKNIDPSGMVAGRYSNFGFLRTHRTSDRGIPQPNSGTPLTNYLDLTKPNDLNIGWSQGSRGAKYTKVAPHAFGHIMNDYVTGYPKDDTLAVAGHGSYYSGSPIHIWNGRYRSGGTDYAGWPYSQYGSTYVTYAHRGTGYESWIGYYHSQLAQGQLENKSRRSPWHKVIIDQLPSKENLNGSTEVIYPRSATYLAKDSDGNYQKKSADVTLTLTGIHYYKNWHGSRSILFSRDLHQGFRYNGIIGATANYAFYDSKTGNPVHFDHGAYIQINHLDGISMYGYPQPRDNSSKGSYTDDTSVNNETLVNTLLSKPHFLGLPKGSTTDPTGQFVTSGDSEMNPMAVSKKGDTRINSYIDPEIRTTVYGGAYNSYYKTSGDHSVAFKIPSDKGTNFIIGSGVGYGLFKPSTKINKPKSHNKPTLFTCSLDSNKKPSTNLRVGTKASRYQLSDGNKYSLTEAQYKKIVNSHKRVTSNGLSYWEKDVAPCSVTPPATPGTPIRKSVMPVGPDNTAKLHVEPTTVSDSHSHNDPSTEGFLRKPKQTYWYKVTGKVPDYPTGFGKTYTESSDKSYDSKGHENGNITYKTPINTDDHYNFVDNLPSDVSIVDSYTRWSNGNDASDSAQETGGNQVSLDLGRNNNDNGYSPSLSNPYRTEIPSSDDYGGSLAKRSGQTYTIYIKVRANHLPNIQQQKKQGWVRYYNGYKSNGGTYANEKLLGKSSTDYSNPVPVQIKALKANIWHYDYNHDRHIAHNAFFPDKKQPFGIENGVTNPDSSLYQNYRFHKYFNPRDPKGELDHSTEYWYVGSHHNVKVLSKSKSETTAPNGQKVRYRTIYPTLDSSVQSGDKNFDSIENEISNDYNTFSQNKADPNPDVFNNGVVAPDKHASDSDHVIMNANAQDSNYYTDNGSSDDFTQNNYLPYYIPRISLDQTINPSDGKPYTGDKSKENNPKYDYDPAEADSAYDMIIDTDKQDHGLPFRLEMHPRNLLYGTQYLNNFKNDTVKTTITDAPYSDVTSNGITNSSNVLYQNKRHLVGPLNDTGSLLHMFTYHHPMHHWTEDPSGDNNAYRGYVESHGFNSPKAGLNSDTDQYKLNTVDKNFKPGDEIPVYVHFDVHDDNGDEIDTQDFKTHAYISNDDQITSKKTPSDGSQNNEPKVGFGTKRVEGEDGDNSKANYSDVDHEISKDKATDPNKATIISPERTEAYGGDTQGNDVRELKEELTATQPRNAIGKTGYGISANDLGLVYKGHLEAPHYAHHGTNMQFAFPKEFNNRDSEIGYSHDNRSTDNERYNTSGLLADNLQHVDPQVNSESDDDFDNDNPSLDTGNSDEQYVHDLYDSYLRSEWLHNGNFATTFGFYPRATINNDGGNNDSQNGDVVLSNKENPLNKFKGMDSNGNAYGDPKLNSNNNVSSVRQWGLLTNSLTGTSSNSNTIDKDGQNERMFTPYFLKSGLYPDIFHRAYSNNSDTPFERFHRLGGNFFDIDENRPIDMIGHQYIAKDSKTQDNDELSLQPILTNPKNGLMQVPKSSPTFYNNWLDNNLWTGLYKSPTNRLD